MWAIYWQDIEVKHGKRIGTEQKIQGPNSAVLLQLFLLQFMRTKGGGGPLPLTNIWHLKPPTIRMKASHNL